MLRRILGIPKIITIEWSYPKKVDDVLKSQTLKEERWGLYQISTKIEKEITFLYIGKSWEDYHKRLKDHKKNWFEQYEGEKYVRFGSFNKRINKIHLGEIESAIIFETNLIQNTQCTFSYKINHDYIITSIENRGAVPSLVKTEVY
jgi:hypothetical protein